MNLHQARAGCPQHTSRLHAQLICILGLLLALLLDLDSAHASSAVLATTRSGTLRGTQHEGIYAFKDIPYGANTATRRFRAPLVAPSWDGVRDARQQTVICPQPAGSTLPQGLQASEDCLRLNVWTPGLRDAGKRPVLVYFHGGGYNHGSVSEALYDGAKLSARGDVVVVTVNHRINGFGYLYLAELGGPRYADSGNAGMLDLVLALRWVQTHSAEFGGDPDRVTIFGQSGGGAKCATLMAMPAARELFHRVWTMSGQQLTGRRASHATTTAREVLARLGLQTSELRQLETRPWTELSVAMQGATWTPVVDGSALPRDPFAPDAAPQSMSVPMVLGNTRDETTSLIGPADPTTFTLQWSEVAGKLRQHVAPFIGALSPEQIVADYRRWYPRATPSQVFFSASTAARSWKGMLLESQRRAEQGAPTWTYYLHWRSPVAGGRWGAPHTLDIPMVFGTLQHSPYTTENVAAARRVSNAMMDALIAFAHSGNPDVDGRPHWPKFDLQDRAAMIFTPAPYIEADPRRRERLLFAPIEYVQPGT